MGGLYLFIYDFWAGTKEILGMKFITPKNNWTYYQKVLNVMFYLILQYSTSCKFGSTKKVSTSHTQYPHI